MIGGQAKVGRTGRGKKVIQKDYGGEREGQEQGGRGAGWPFLQSFDTPFVSLAHSNLHTQYAAAVS